ncbi:MAG TPA: CHAD domain-containing protein [Solirubrobacteraceae bacterium]|nr:CHAD domain-containing protein [Solirubrobacteraceae bacterium]
MTLAATVLVGVTVAVAALARAERGRRAMRAGLPERERHFGLLAGEPAAEGLRRVALGQLDLAIELLAGESTVSPDDEAVHETRKALKRLRALLRLLEDALGPGRAARERAVVREAASRLAGARDAEVMVGTLDALVRRHPRRLGRRRGVIELRAHLERERVAAAARALGAADRSATPALNGWAEERALPTAERTHAAAELSALRDRVASWTLPDRPVGKLVDSGLVRVYREGRVRFGRAAARKPSPTALHRWRKHVKDLRYVAEVLDVQSAPDADAARATTSGDGRLAKLARRADALGELLGEEHDLALLAELARTDKRLQRRKRARRALLRTIARRRARLRERALRAGGRLYARKPKRFVRRMRASYQPTLRP